VFHARNKEDETLKRVFPDTNDKEKVGRMRMLQHSQSTSI